MKNLRMAAVLLMLAALFITTAFGQKPKSKEDAYNELAGFSRSQKPEDLAKAYGLAKDFLARFGTDKDERIPKIKMFVDGYRQHLFQDAITAGRTADAFAMGKEILADQPDNLDVLLNLVNAGYNAMNKKDRTFADDSITYSKKAVQILETSLLPKSLGPFKNKDEATAFMYYMGGNLSLERDRKDGTISIYKSTLLESPIKNYAVPYYLIAAYYEDVYAKLSADLKAKIDAKTISDADQKAATDRVNKVIDLMLDAYARTCKRSEAEKNPNNDVWQQRLAQVYKFRKETDSGLAEFINYVNTTPLPDPGAF